MRFLLYLLLIIGWSSLQLNAQTNSTQTAPVATSVNSTPPTTSDSIQQENHALQREINITEMSNL
jgi:hypothetical protein